MDRGNRDRCGAFVGGIWDCELGTGTGNFEKGFRFLTMDRFWQYVSECLRILYWAFFKPFTFRKWLREEVHPDLRLDTNPFELQAEFATNHRLRRYAGQVMAVSAYAPVVITIMTGIIYSFFNSKPFDWYPSSLFLVSWIVGLWIRRIGKSIFKNIFYDLSIGFLIFWIISNFGGKIFPAFAGIEMVAFGVAFGVAGGLAVLLAFLVGFFVGN
ncbi:MAG: hypothetical protein LH649_09220 [Pseudanabaena sp. CAN_BIN31]|nr:hypothetical protein [Pseudanabaena sp. CAN_BIN31]